jgi:hypothetical protein
LALGQNDHIPDMIILGVFQQKTDIHRFARAGSASEARRTGPYNLTGLPAQAIA